MLIYLALFYLHYVCEIGCVTLIYCTSLGGPAIFQEPHMANGYHVGQCGSKQLVECYQNPKSSFLKVIVKYSNFFKAIVMFWISICFLSLWKIIHLETKEIKITTKCQHKKNYNCSLARCTSWFLCSFFSHRFVHHTAALPPLWGRSSRPT